MIGYTYEEINKQLDQRDAMMGVMLDAKSKYCANRNLRCDDCEYCNETCDCEVMMFAEALINAGYGFMGE